MKIGIAQINLRVADLDANAAKIIDSYQKLVAMGAELVVFPELALCGYYPGDWLTYGGFIRAQKRWAEHIAANCNGPAACVFGLAIENTSRIGPPCRNAAAWCEDGIVRVLATKSLLPNYAVFDEARHFAPSLAPLVLEYREQRIGLTICEDIWNHPAIRGSVRYPRDPIAEVIYTGVDIILNISASPWQPGKNAVREEILRTIASSARCPMVYANIIGGQDELIFDGASLVINGRGELIAHLPQFKEALEIVDIATAPPLVEPGPRAKVTPIEEIHQALILGIRDYAAKTNFTQAIVALSGGIDSALVAALAVEALGSENVMGISLPSAISSEHSRSDAVALAKNLGIECPTVSIESIVDATHTSLAPYFQDRDPDSTEENIQSRSRALLLMALSNKFGRLLLTTGNKSELAVGYCTLYGDMCGGLAPIGDLFKTKVYELSHWINRAGIIIPESTLTKPPSAELRPGQLDTDTLPPYATLDAILSLYIEECLCVDEITERGFERAIVEDVIRKVNHAEYKRRQYAPVIRVSPIAFGIGRRIPIVQGPWQ